MADGRPGPRLPVADDTAPERANVRPLREPAPTSEPAPPAEVAPGTSAAPSNRTRRRVLLALGPLVLLAAALYLYLTGGRFVTTDNAYVRAD